MTKLITDRPKKYQPMLELQSIVSELKPGSVFKGRSVDGFGILGAFVKLDGSTIYYTNIRKAIRYKVWPKTVNKIMTHRIIKIQVI